MTRPLFRISYETLLRRIGAVIPSDPNHPAFEAMQELWQRLIVERQSPRRIRRSRRIRPTDTLAEIVSDAEAFQPISDPPELVEAQYAALAAAIEQAGGFIGRSAAMRQVYNLAPFKRSKDRRAAFAAMWDLIQNETAKVTDR